MGDEYSETKVMQHLILMYEAGLLTGEPERSSTSDRVIRVLPFELTWEGHEFLAKIRSETVWEKVKALSLSHGGSLSFTLLNQIATRLATKLPDIL